MKSCKALLLLAVLFALALGASADTGRFAYRLKGVVVDSLTKAGEPYATLNIVSPKDKTKPLTMAVTDADGRFGIDANGTGNYVLIVRSVGRNTIELPFSVDGKKKVIDLGTLLCSDSPTELKGVEVVAYKPLVKADIDKLTYSVEDDPESDVASVTEMLKKVPMVTVDAEDNIKVKGSSSFKIYVNGKPDNMMTSNAKQILKSMPASSIKKIEVITNPGPKYDAEGVGGILNIITTGKGLEGYTATVKLTGTSRGVGSSLFATVKTGKLTLSANYNNAFQKHPPTTHSNEQSVFNDLGTETRHSVNESTNRNKVAWHNAMLEASYEIDTLRLLTASFAVNLFHSNVTGNGTVLSTAPQEGLDLYSYSTLMHSRNTYNDFSGGVDYQRSFKTKDRLLTLSYRIEGNPSKETGSQEYSDFYAHETYSDYLRRIRNQRTDGTRNSTEHTFQIDYTTPFAKWHTFEAGAKYIMRLNNAATDKYDVPAGKDEAETYDTEGSSDYKHRNDILAAYLGYGLSLKKWSARLGLRYEHTFQKVEYRLGRGADFSRNFDDVVPSVKLGYKFSDIHNLSFNYKMRISRPGIWELNPYLDNSDPEHLSQGNSDLVSEKIHSFDIEYGSFGQKINCNFSLGYEFSRNGIESVDIMTDDRAVSGLQDATGKEVLYTTYRNIGRRQRASLQCYVGWTPFDGTRITVNGSGEYTRYTDGQALENHGWSMNLYGSIEQTVAKTWSFVVGIYKSTPEISLQGKGSGFFSESLSMKKSWLDKRLTASLAVANPFNWNMKWKQNTVGNNFRYVSNNRFCIGYVGAAISYRFGKLESGVKKAARTIVNDDVSSSPKGGSKGGM